MGLSLLATAAGCAAGVASPERAPAGELRRNAAPTSRATVDPDAPVAARGPYGPDPAVALVPLEARALAAVRARLRPGHGGATPRVSGALVLAARALARAAARGDPEPLARDRVRAALARGLAFDPSPAAVLIRRTPADAVAALADHASPADATHVGVGAFERDGSVWVVLLASERQVALSPFPRDVTAGSTHVLEGTLRSGLHQPRVYVTLPSGDVREADVAGTRPFRASLGFDAAGRSLVEIVAQGPRGPEVVALLTISAGGAALDAPAATRARADPEDPATAEAAVVAALNATRRGRGLAPLASDPALAEVARRHSADMRARGIVAHVLPGSGDLSDRLRRAHVGFRRALENVARAGTTLEAHEAAEESPAHRGNILAPDVSRVGVGIARGRLASGDAAVYLTEVFLDPVDDGAESPLTPDTRVREALWNERARRGRPPLTADPALDALARDAAESMRASGAPDAGDMGRRALELGRSISAVDVFVASAPGEAIRSANLGDARFRRVGVGVTSGDSRRFGVGRLFIAVVYTD